MKINLSETHTFSYILKRTQTSYVKFSSYHDFRMQVIDSPFSYDY